MKDKAGGATERARGDRFGTNGAPRQRGDAAGMRGRKSACNRTFGMLYLHSSSLCKSA